MAAGPKILNQPKDAKALGGKLFRYVGLLRSADRAQDRPFRLSSNTRVVFADKVVLQPVSLPVFKACQTGGGGSLSEEVEK
jgi:hypothetical protein